MIAFSLLPDTSYFLPFLSSLLLPISYFMCASPN